MARARLEDEERDHSIFTSGDPHRPACSAVWRRLTENASRDHEKNPERPCRQAVRRDPQSVSNSNRGSTEHLRPPRVSRMSAEAPLCFRGRLGSIRFRSCRVYGRTSAGITSEEVSPLCSNGGLHNVQVHLCAPAQFCKANAECWLVGCVKVVAHLSRRTGSFCVSLLTRWQAHGRISWFHDGPLRVGLTWTPMTIRAKYTILSSLSLPKTRTVCFYTRNRCINVFLIPNF